MRSEHAGSGTADARPPPAEAVRMAPRISSRDVWIVLGNTLALIVLLVLLWRVRTIVSWVLAAFIIALALEPVLQALMRRGVRRGWAVLIVCIVFATFLAGLFATLIPLLVDQARSLADRAPELLKRLQDALPSDLFDGQLSVEDIGQAVSERGAQAAGPAVDVATAVVHAVVGVITVLVLAVFAMLFGDELVQDALAWIPPERRAYWEDLGERMKSLVGRYVLGTLLVSSIGGLVMGITTLALGVPYFLALALVMVVLGVVPYLGSAMGALLVIGVTFSTTGLTAALIAAVIYLVYQQIENHVLQPVVQRRTMRMNPLVISLALLVGTSLAGILGTLLALPIAGVLQIILHDLAAHRDAQRDAQRATTTTAAPS
jgi:predicted PurR-regulated permease PerM